MKNLIESIEGLSEAKGIDSSGYADKEDILGEVKRTFGDIVKTAKKGEKDFKDPEKALLGAAEIANQVAVLTGWISKGLGSPKDLVKISNQLTKFRTPLHMVRFNLEK